MKIQNFNYLIIKVLDTFLQIFDITLNAFFKFFDYLIKTLETVLKKIINLINRIFQLLYYLLSFILMIIIGTRKNWTWMTFLGWFVLLSIGILFFRDFIAFKLQSKSEPELEQTPTKTKKIFILFLNVLLLIIYSIMYFNANAYITRLIKTNQPNTKADNIREVEYLSILKSDDSDQYEISEAIDNLGKLKSNKSKSVLIDRLMNFNTRKEILDQETLSEINSIIKALENIGGEEACNSLVLLEVRSRDVQVKKMARKAANRICGNTIK